MNANKIKLKFLQKAKNDFEILARKSKYKAMTFKIIDFMAKVIISIGGAIITFFSEPKEEANFNVSLKVLRAIGITITVLTALSTLFMFEKRSLSHIQIYTKCSTIIPEIEERIENEDIENVKDYVKSIYKELSILSLASFMDSLSSRNIKSGD